ncbi:PREDICTED: epididymal secretory protein E1-like [Branchiostoma belcheri]|uniref:NPC intracellular cholesterol transporter 2 n=1 Tax=Branchiostoma belcheri TaxID=7741 RepID=A0A6P4Z8R8_BRABE|nr:PREDICTED: epididymal secretory protein E1-like [Branchiostoma belcheri]KAI8482755.1 Phosphatidylglycerol/phosphatidylinositol transfer protein [Branchiostoma belcheri]
MLIRAVFIVAFVASVAVAESVKYLDCGSSVGKIAEVDVTPCPAEPCELIKGGNTSIAVKFTSNEVVNNATSVVHGILAGVPVPFPLSNPDGCKDSGLECPLKSSTTYTYTTILPVKPVYPQLKLVVKWELKDEKKNDIFCFEVPVKIVKK